MEKLTGRWLVAVSGGADSMSLLDQCYNLDMDIAVAHVDYQKRTTSKRDALGVEEYCRKRGIPFYKHVVSCYRKGNFQSVARDIRYAFFKKLIDELNCEGVLVAHHKDDLIETYLLQINRNTIPDYYGIKPEVYIHGCLVKRVLLDKSKQQLIAYCQEHHIEYYEDETNASNLYQRNIIRHEQVEKMSEDEKNEIIAKINQMNELRAYQLVQVDQFLKRNKPEIMIEDFRKLDKSLQLDVLRTFILRNTPLKKVGMINLKHLSNQLNEFNKNFKFVIGKYTIYCEYGKLSIENARHHQYKYLLDRYETLDTKYFSINQKGTKIESLTVKVNDLPIMIRNYQIGDKIQMCYGTKRLSRFFIDRKIPQHIRDTWPVVTDKNGKVIFVCGLGCDASHYSDEPNLYIHRINESD